jgi:hypothetical protein
MHTRRGLILSTAALAMVLGAAAGWAGSGLPTISKTEAQAAGAATMSVQQCISVCQSNSQNKTQCPSNCGAGQCYKNPNSGRSYCVR